jgi:hypothetical protein
VGAVGELIAITASAGSDSVTLIPMIPMMINDAPRPHRIAASQTHTTHYHFTRTTGNAAVSEVLRVVVCGCGDDGTRAGAAATASSTRAAGRRPPFQGERMPRAIK